MHTPVPVLPNFFLAGAPKAGTTSLYHYLRQHPAVYMSPVKEPHYFALEIRPENFAAPTPSVSRLIVDWPAYLALFRDAGSASAIGEASVCYLWSPTAARAIAERIPNARILVILRDPADRAWSQYVQGVAGGHIHGTLREHIDASLQDTGCAFRATYPFLQLGHYAAQLRRWFALFPRDRIRILFYDDYLRDPAATLRHIFEFLDIDATFRPDISEHYHLFPERAAHPFAAADRRLLTAHYREDILALSALLDRDFSAWLA